MREVERKCELLISILFSSFRPAESSPSCPARTACTSTSTLAPACGPTLPSDRAASIRVRVGEAQTIEIVLLLIVSRRFPFAEELSDGFSCPAVGETRQDSNGQVVVHPKFPHPTDCQQFYVCLNGVEPRALGCGPGEVYNDETQRCDAPENVPGCEDWYAEDKKN